MFLKICSVDGCEKPVKAGGFCGNHYATNRRNGTPIPLRIKNQKRGPCNAKGCTALSSAKGYCPKHYARFIKYGSPNLPPPKPAWRCSVDDCKETKHKAHGMCRFHYERAKEGRRLDLAKIPKIKGGICSIAECNRPHRASGFCNMHYLRFINHGDVNYNIRRIEYGKGREWYKKPNGYVSRFEPSNSNAGSNGQVYQHRHVMSEHLGRPLQKNENVHHKNGDRADNRMENLELWSTSQPSGQRVTDKVKWCIDFLSKEMIEAVVKIDPSLTDDLLVLRDELTLALKGY